MSAPQSSLQLLGSFQLVHHGEPVALGQSRLAELVTLLALSPGTPVTRIQIAHKIWPESSEGQARTNTRNLLYKLKQAWPAVAEAIAIDADAVTWRADAGIEVDVARFQQRQAEAERCERTDERIRLLAAAAACYQGALLPDSFTEWVLNAREQLRGRFVALLEQLVEAQMAQRHYDAALASAVALRDHDPLQETAYQHMMQAYAAQGNRAAALRTYHACATLLRRELGVDPAPAMQAMHARLLQHEAPGALGGETLQAAGRPLLVGRHTEWQQLRQAWRRATQGEAHCVAVWGEAGIGKTRLAEEIVDWVKRQGHAAASSRSYAAKGALSYAPITDWLRTPRLRQAVEAVDDLWRVELARLLPGLLAERPDLPQPGPLAEAWQQQRFFQGIVQAVQVVDGPLLLHLDDMQWSDPETLMLLHYLLHGARDCPLLIVGGIRTEEAHDNPGLGKLLDALRHANQLSELHLTALNRAETVELAQQTGGESVAAVAAEQLFAASEGHPLYLIEIVRSGLALDEPGAAIADGAAIAKVGGDGPGPDVKIPPKIYGLISARLNQLAPSVRQVVNTAAVIGRDFAYDLLAAALPLDELALVDALDDLWSRRLIREQDGLSYDFSHDRIREVAYHEISRARRRLLHRQVAAALEALNQERLDDVAGELAAHWAQAGDSLRAFGHYRRAAKIALSQHALSQAEIMLDAALCHAPTDPAIRFDLLTEQAHVFFASLQFTRLRASLSERAELLATLPTLDLRRELTLTIDRSRYFDAIGKAREGMAAGRAAVELAERLHDPGALGQSYQALANSFWFQSRMAEAAPLYRARCALCA